MEVSARLNKSNLTDLFSLTIETADHFLWMFVDWFLDVARYLKPLLNHAYFSKRNLYDYN